MYEVVTQNVQLDSLYSNIYHLFIGILAFLTIFNTANRENLFDERINDRRSIVVSSILSLMIVAYFGLRTLFDVYIGDTITYHWTWQHNIEQYYTLKFSGDEREWVFILLQVLVYKYVGSDISCFFTVVALMYVGFQYLTCLKLLRNDLWLAFMFMITSFSFFGAGINGIRNGLACSMVMYGIVLLCDKNIKGLILALLLFVTASGIHVSSMLPSLCAIAAFLFIKKPSVAIGFWFVSIFLSLLIGDKVTEWFVGLGFDDRFEDYLTMRNEEINMQKFSSVGFRWDFLFYSFMPVLMTWYVTIKRNFKDITFNLISITYILSNSFWIMVIRASYSNRFAYLSWFLYPLVIAYPLLRMNICEKQHLKVTLILLLYSMFTFGMYVIGL